MTPGQLVRIGNACLYHGDAREILPRMLEHWPDLAGGCVIADPPYGIGYVHGGHGRGAHAALRDGGRKWGQGKTRNANRPIAGDDEPFDPAIVTDRFRHALLWGANHYARRLPEGGSWVCWNKSPGARGPADNFSDAEFAWASWRVKRNVIEFLWKGLACVKAGEENGARPHPTTKPQGVMLRCLELAPPGALPIIDPYMGSGSTGVACAARGLPFVGIELDRQHFETACARIERAQRQGNLLEAGACA